MESPRSNLIYIFQYVEVFKSPHLEDFSITFTVAMCRALQSLYFATVSTPHFKIASPVPLSNVCRSGQGCFRLAGRVTGDTLIDC